MPPTPRRHGAAVRAAGAALVGLGALLARPGGARAQPATPARAAPAAGRVLGTVVDSVDGAPLAGATVQLARRDAPSVEHTTTTDSLGRFALDSVAAGAYLAGFHHPRLDVLGVEPPPRLVTIGAAGMPALALATPGARALRHALCGADVRDSAGVVVGVVRDADGGGPLVGATVSFSWVEYALTRTEIQRVARRVTATTAQGGLYAACGLPTDEDVLVEASMPARGGGVVQVAPRPGGLLVQELALGDSASARLVDVDAVANSGRRPDATRAAGRDDTAPVRPPAARVARGRARLVGRVRRGDGAPVPGAQLQVWGTGLEARTAADGSYAIAGLPAGTYSVEARALGYAPTRRAVDLGSGRTTAANLTLDTRVATLSEVAVLGRRSERARDFDGFYKRRQRGMGQFLLGADVARFVRLSDALATTPSLRVVPGVRGATILGRFGCNPALFIDGYRVQGGMQDLDVLLRPSDVKGIEAHWDGANVPAQIGGADNSCTAIFVWTKP